MKDYYVILTGSKNNAGDFLIKYRAKKLFSVLRPDREVIDIDGWKAFDIKTLKTVNSAKALILMGGPALQMEMYPKIYPLTKNLDDITVPIVMMGVGWKSMNGEWKDTYDYSLSQDTLCLLKKIQLSGLLSSVRDFHTLNSLACKGFDQIIMTGCPAYYELDSIGKEVVFSGKINKVAFSLGVSFISSHSMEKHMKQQILKVKNYFVESELEVVFHHALDPSTFLKVHGATQQHSLRYNQFATWLKEQNISFVDISGSAENLINYYSQVDLHIGYRVHAHIFMNSLSKLSVLIAEDGRAKATRLVIGGIVIDGFKRIKTGLIVKVMKKFLPLVDSFIVNEESTEDIINHIKYELLSKGHRTRISRILIDENFNAMKNFIGRLP